MNGLVSIVIFQISDGIGTVASLFGFHPILISPVTIDSGGNGRYVFVVEINLPGFLEAILRRGPIVPQIFCQTMRFFAGVLGPGKKERRSMTGNLRCERCASYSRIVS